MWIRRKMKEPLVLYLLLFLIMMTQVFASAQFFKEADAFLNYRMNSKYMIQYAKAMMGTYSYFLMNDGSDPSMQDMKKWAALGEQVSLYARDVFAQRYFQTDLQKQERLPINEDLHVLIDLANLYGFDYQRHGVPRPETLIGQAQWDRLREYYRELGTPEGIIDRLIHPYDRYLGEHAADAPLLQREDNGYYFYVQKILYYVNVVLSDFPTMQYHSAPPPILLNQLLGNRIILLVYIVFCIFLTATSLSEDRQYGTIKLLAAKPQGRVRYVLSTYTGSLLLAVGGMLAALFPGVLLAVFLFGGKGFNYPSPYLPYSYRNLDAFPMKRGELVSDGFGIFSRGRTLHVTPRSFDEMQGFVEVWRLLLAAFIFLTLLASLMLLIGFLVSTLSRHKSVTAAIAILPMGLAVASLFDFRFASASFPYNPFSAMDIMTTATGMQDFTALSAFLALVLWNIAAFCAALWVIQRRNLG